MVGYERLTGTRWKLRPRLFGLPEGIRRNSLFPGEGNHIPRSTVMVNEHSLRPLTEPLPPATPFRCAAGPWVHLPAPCTQAKLLSPTQLSRQQLLSHGSRREREIVIGLLFPTAVSNCFSLSSRSSNKFP